jgi:hypothetical protein
MLCVAYIVGGKMEKLHRRLPLVQRPGSVNIESYQSVRHRAQMADRKSARPTSTGLPFALSPIGAPSTSAMDLLVTGLMQIAKHSTMQLRLLPSLPLEFWQTIGTHASVVTLQGQLEYWRREKDLFTNSNDLRTIFTAAEASSSSSSGAKKKMKLLPVDASKLILLWQQPKWMRFTMTAADSDWIDKNPHEFSALVVHNYDLIQQLRLLDISHCSAFWRSPASRQQLVSGLSSSSAGLQILHIMELDEAIEPQMILDLLAAARRTLRLAVVSATHNVLRPHQVEILIAGVHRIPFVLPFCFYHMDTSTPMDSGPMFRTSIPNSGGTGPQAMDTSDNLISPTNPCDPYADIAPHLGVADPERYTASTRAFLEEWRSKLGHFGLRIIVQPAVRALRTQWIFTGGVFSHLRQEMKTMDDTDDKYRDRVKMRHGGGDDDDDDDAKSKKKAEPFRSETKTYDFWHDEVIFLQIEYGLPTLQETKLYSLPPPMATKPLLDRVYLSYFKSRISTDSWAALASTLEERQTLQGLPAVLLRRTLEWMCHQQWCDPETSEISLLAFPLRTFQTEERNIHTLLSLVRYYERLGFRSASRQPVRQTDDDYTMHATVGHVIQTIAAMEKQQPLRVGIPDEDNFVVLPPPAYRIQQPSHVKGLYWPLFPNPPGGADFLTLERVRAAHPLTPAHVLAFLLEVPLRQLSPSRSFRSAQRQVRSEGRHMEGGWPSDMAPLSINFDSMKIDLHPTMLTVRGVWGPGSAAHDHGINFSSSTTTAGVGEWIQIPIALVPPLSSTLVFLAYVLLLMTLNPTKTMKEIVNTLRQEPPSENDQANFARLLMQHTWFL